MDDNLNFDTFLFISSKKFNISVYSSSNKKLYEKELFFKLEFEEEIIEKFDYFLNENIFKVEKKLGNFIKNVSIVLDLNIFSCIFAQYLLALNVSQVRVSKIL